MNSDSEEEEDFSKGIHTFLNGVRKRRKARKSETEPCAGDIGVENRIVGATTFEKTYWSVFSTSGAVV